MKTYNQMSVDVLKRIDEYKVKQTHRKAVAKRAATGALCICIAVMASVGIRKGVSESTLIPHSSSYASSTENADKIIINRTNIEESEVNRKMFFCLRNEDFIKMNRDQLVEYYGLNIFPSVPSDLKYVLSDGLHDVPYINDDSFGIYRRDGGKGEVYYDLTILNYSNEDFSRSVNIELQKGKLPFSCCAFFEDIKDESIINNVSVKIVQSENGYYYASFMHKNVGFKIVSEGLSQNELVDVISSLAK